MVNENHWEVHRKKFWKDISSVELLTLCVWWGFLRFPVSYKEPIEQNDFPEQAEKNGIFFITGAEYDTFDA